jgi:hypothetical protein
MSGINFDYKGDYPFTPYVSLMQYQNLTYSSIDIELTVTGKAADYSAAGISIADNVNFTNAVDHPGSESGGVFTVSLEDLKGNKKYYVKGYTTVGGTNKYTIRYWYFTTPANIALGAISITALADTSLTLNCSITKALDTGDSVGFEYASDAEFTTPTNVAIVTDDFTGLNFAKEITGLTAGNTYYVRAWISIVEVKSYTTGKEVQMHWTITLPTPENGTVTADPDCTHIADGEAIGFIFTPAEGYELATAKANDVNIMSSIEGGIYYVESVTESITITATFTK